MQAVIRAKGFRPTGGGFARIEVNGIWYAPEIIVEALEQFAKRDDDSEFPRSADTIAAEAYQVIGALADAAGLFDHPEVIRALDYFSDGYEQEGTEILPFHVDRDLNLSLISPFTVQGSSNPDQRANLKERAEMIVTRAITVGREFGWGECAGVTDEHMDQFERDRSAVIAKLEAALTTALATAHHTLAEQAERIGALEAGLRPFAEASVEVDDRYLDNDHLAVTLMGPGLRLATMGDLRRARALLTKATPE